MRTGNEKLNGAIFGLGRIFGSSLFFLAHLATGMIPGKRVNFLGRRSVIDGGVGGVALDVWISAFYINKSPDHISMRHHTFDVGNYLIDSHHTFDARDHLIDSLLMVLNFQPINQLFDPPQLVPTVLLLRPKSDLASSKPWDLSVARCRTH